MDAATLSRLHRQAAPRRRQAERRLIGAVPAARLAAGLGVPALVDSLLLIGLLAALVAALDPILFSGAGPPEVLPWVAGALLLSALRIPLRMHADRAASHLGQQVVDRLRREQLHTALAPRERLAADPGTGLLQQRIGENLDRIAPYYARYLPALASALLQPLLILVVVFSLNWLAGLLLLFTAPLIPLFMALIGMGTQVLADRQQTALMRLAGLFRDRLRGLATLRLFRAAHDEATRLEQRSEDYRQRSMGVLRVAFLSSATLEFFSAVAIAVLAVYVGFSLLGYYDFGPAAGMGFLSGMLILVLAPEFFLPLRRLGQHYHDRSAALAAMMDLPESAQDGMAIPEGERLSSGTGARVQSRGLILQPPGGPGIAIPDMDLAPGRIAVISGPSGSGKSLLAAALAGVLKPAEGNLSVADRDPATIHPRDIGWLGQTPHLLPGSLRFNLDPAEQNLPDGRLWEALAEAHLASDLEAAGVALDTRLGPGDGGLSGGEAQRLSLARALLQQPPLLVLDEPTASLDRAATENVVATLQRLRGQSSVVVLSHDPLIRECGDIHLELEPPDGH